ncbi:hypothetical protein A2Y83_04860 [Candidatus Falkowbacteria bacterium RBG_13_39_14]|uniref:UPF0235 protein A2Y83_04860 n=1 Tax=Candidatus Falkowbacteria bacterium RBG_13_39_14 TaxID=1797985 RepID=A0A1F5S1K8_9BACT|nr:MAG: hypothetical protein A2Y83_04860 [Candidatus Falkowbacteria bacterium RBG_13_39_14]
MIISIKVIPRAKKNEVIKIDEFHYRARIVAAPVDGKANNALIKFLSEYFGVGKSKISIIKGDRGREKVVELDGVTRI